jgi:mannose-6-phosphate isomerase-like protein (cupin superfamily)
MKIYKENLETKTLDNNYYRRIVSTTPQQQLVLMCIETGEEIGEEIHPHTTQFIRVESGRGVAYVNGKRYNLKDGDAIVIPPGASHNIRSTDTLKLYTIYSPPEH